MSHLRAFAVSDAGRVRPTNQDIAFTSEDLIAVADGMGGHAAGDTAARLAIDTLVASFARPAQRDSLVAAARRANEEVYDEAGRREELRGMGTTLTAAAVVGSGAASELVLVNVGDSRAYMLAGEEIVQLTEDHSLVEQLVRQGELTPEEAAVHPHRHILTRAIGIDPAVEIDSWIINPRPGTRLLICSDGLTNECSEEEIATVLRDHLDPADAASDLVRRALAHGGNDNVTVVVADVEADEPLDDELPESFSHAAGDVMAPAGLAPTGPSGLAATGDTAAAAVAGGLGESGGASEPAGLGEAVEAGEAGEAGEAPVRARARAMPLRRAASDSRPTPRSTEHILTPRVVIFVLLLVATLGGVIGFTVWFDKATYFVGVDHNHVAIFEGRPGGMLWFHPSLVERSPTPVSAVLDADLPLLRAGVLEPSFADAERVATNLEHETSLTDTPPSTTPATTPSSATTTTTNGRPLITTPAPTTTIVNVAPSTTLAPITVAPTTVPPTIATTPTTIAVATTAAAATPQ